MAVKDAEEVENVAGGRNTEADCDSGGIHVYAVDIL